MSHCQIQMSLQQLLLIRATQRLLWMFRSSAKTTICPPDHNKTHKLLWTLATRHLPTDPSDNKMKWWFLLRKWKLKLMGNNLLDQMLGQMQKLEKTSQRLMNSLALFEVLEEDTSMCGKMFCAMFVGK